MIASDHHRPDARGNACQDGGNGFRPRGINHANESEKGELRLNAPIQVRFGDLSIRYSQDSQRACGKLVGQMHELVPARTAKGYFASASKFFCAKIENDFGGSLRI